jgi:hypothetical protein
MAKPLVKANINLSQLGFKIVEKNGKKFIFAELTDEISFYENNPQIRLVGWELPTKKGTAPLKLDYEEGKSHKGTEQYPPTIGWANVGSVGTQQQQQQQNDVPPFSPDDLPV